MTPLAIILLAILITSFVIFNISSINLNRNEETMKPETTISGKPAYGINSEDVIILQRALELFIKQAKDVEKDMPKELKKMSETVVKRANKTLRKLKAIRKQQDF